MLAKVKFIDVKKTGFFSTVRERVDNYFTENNISKTGNAAMYFKTVFFLGGLLLFYGLIISNQFGLITMWVLSALLGMFAAFIGFNICHDAIHGSYSTNTTLNKVLGYLFNLIGANAYLWSIAHNVVHHTYTNIHGHDEDIEIAPGLIRLNPEEKANKIQRYQHYYAFFLYSLASLSWVMRKDYIKFFKKNIGTHVNDHPKKEYVKLFLFKFLYYLVFIVLPLVFVDITWWQFIIGFLTMHFAEGLVLGLVFQLAHVVELTEFPDPNEDGNIEEAWAVHQMRTTANFARKSPIAAFLCGGLNMQVEHHLFPKICHIHYPVISEIVRETAIEFGIPYHEYPTFGEALVSHFKVLKRFSRPELEYSA